MILTLFSFTALLFLLPFVPALVELARRRDAQPLHVSDEHEADLRHSAKTFSAYATQTLMPHVRNTRLSTQSVRKPLSDGTSLHLLAEADPVFLKRRLLQADLSRDIVTFCLPADLPGNLAFAREVFAADRLAAGASTTFDSLFAENDVHLEVGSQVVRWLHAKGTVTAEAGTTLNGSVSSDKSLIVRDDCYFERLNAPIIHLGTNKHYLHLSLYDGIDLNRIVDRTAPRVQERHVFEPTEVHDRTEQRTLILGDLHIPPFSDVRGNFVVRGEVIIGEGARVYGSVKSSTYIAMEQNAHVHGGLFSTAHLVIGSYCHVTGLVVAEGKLGIGEGAVIGTPRTPTTITAKQLYVDPGVTAHGTVWALERGWVGTKGFEPEAG